MVVFDCSITNVSQIEIQVYCLIVQNDRLVFAH